MEHCGRCTRLGRVPAKRASNPGPSGLEPRERDVLGPLERGRALYAQRAWAEAHEALSLADRAAPLDAEDLERLALSAGLAGRDEEQLASLERLYHAHCEADETVRAARAAFWLGFRLLTMGEPARGSGWLARAQRLVEHEDCVVRGYLLLPVIRRHFAAGDYEAAYAGAVSAAEIGERFAELDLVTFARNLQGRILVYQGQLESGLALLDEAMVAATAGEL